VGKGSQAKPPERPERRRILFPSLLAAVSLLAIALAWLTWAKWGDVVIDVGRELEVPWKITEGQVLYRDLAYNYGPLSPYLNAAFLEVFGLHLGSLLLDGFLSAAIGAGLVYLLARRFVGRTLSLAFVVVFLLECVFQHYLWNGSFQFLLPYSFPAVHSILFALGALLALERSFESGSLRWLAAAGALGGLAALCKIEIAAALAAALAASSTVLARRIWREPARAVGHGLAWGAPFAAVTVAGYLPFLAASSYGRVVTENVFKSSLVDVGSNVFFLRQLGIDDLGAGVGALGASALFWSAAAALLYAAARLDGLREGADGRGEVPFGILLAALVWAASWFVLSPMTVFRAVPLVALAVAVRSGIRVLRDASEDRPADGFAAAFGVFALLAVGRIVLNVGTYQYGFFMALPGVILLGVFLASILPRWVGMRERVRRPFAAFVCVLLVVVSARNFVTGSLPKFRGKTMEIAGPHGRMHAFPWRPRYEAIRIALQHLEEHHPDPDETLLVIPEGAALNFLTGRRNPTSYNLLIPPELAPPGVEERIVEQIRENRIDTILLIDRAVDEYGYRGPGIDYALDLMRFVEEAYRAEARIGPRPYSLGPGREGGAILYRREGS
jgi:hypothetical protein